MRCVSEAHASLTTSGTVVVGADLPMYVQAAVVLRFGARAKAAEPIFPNDPVDILGARVGQDRLWVLGTVIVITAVLWVRRPTIREP